MKERDTCELCGFSGSLEKHHLVPQVKCHNKYKAVKDDPSNHIFICSMCHRTIHAYFTENELRDRLDTVERLKSDERFSSYLKWRRNHMDFDSNSTKMSNSRKHRR